jgi:4-deoxy-L-threo-5-hexosulose-uronate ketol-isomerase
MPNSKNAYPHAVANFVTREEPCFYARNAIDGIKENQSHGKYPYHSWAGGARKDLEFTIDFGQTVEVDKLTFYLRSDFKHDKYGVPHDSYWKSIDAEFSNGDIINCQFKLLSDDLHEENQKGIEISFDKRKTKSIKLKNFKQATEKLGFAALTQIEVYGKIVKENLNTMEVRQASNAKDVKLYTTERLREEFHIANLFTKDNTRMVYSHIDRIITAGIMPVRQTIKLKAGEELRAEYFLERREMGCINVGGKGIITVDGVEYQMNERDGIYIGKGNKDITFKSIDENDPAKFYISSCPAHTSYPTVKIDITKAKKVPCGSVEECNKRVINQYIHPEVIKSCQLAMGLTQLESGSNWNTMPCHTHDRRMEVYLYLDMSEDDVVFHMMGEPTETRHIIMHNEEAVISPSWSIHSGVGTKAYSFIWAMCGENQEFTDMDHIQTRDLL